jgi:hypothetical protein
MNHPLIVATVAFLLLLPQFNNVDAAGHMTANGPVPQPQLMGNASEPL